MSKKRKTPVTIPVQPEQPRTRQLSTFSKVMIALLIADIAIVCLFTILDASGLHLLIPEIISVGSALVPVLLMMWGGVSLYHRIRSERAQRVYRIIGFSLGLGVALFVLVMAAELTMYAMPHSYGTIKSPTGQKVVILQLNDVGAGTEEDYAATIERMNTRVEYLNSLAEAEAAEAEEAEATETEATETEVTETETADVNSESAQEAAIALESYPSEAYGYIYIALPKKMGIFYTSNAEFEGEIYRGTDSKSGLFFEWIDDQTVRFYLENPEPGDSGEMRLTLPD